MSDVQDETDGAASFGIGLLVYAGGVIRLIVGTIRTNRPIVRQSGHRWSAVRSLGHRGRPQLLSVRSQAGLAPALIGACAFTPRTRTEQSMGDHRDRKLVTESLERPGVTGGTVRTRAHAAGLVCSEGRAMGDVPAGSQRDPKHPGRRCGKSCRSPFAALAVVAVLLTATGCGSSGSRATLGSGSTVVNDPASSPASESGPQAGPLDGEWVLTSAPDSCAFDQGSVNGQTLTVAGDHTTITNQHGPFEGNLKARGSTYGIDLDQHVPGQTPDTLETGEPLPPPNLQFDVTITGPDTISGAGQFSMVNPTGQTGASCKRTFAGVRKGSPAGDALDLVRRVYEPYLQPGSPVLSNCLTPGAPRCAQDVEAFVSPALNAKLTAAYDFDPVLCAQNVPTVFFYDAPTVRGNQATVVVHESYTSRAAPQAPPRNVPEGTVTVTVDLDPPQLTDISCDIH